MYSLEIVIGAYVLGQAVTAGIMLVGCLAERFGVEVEKIRAEIQSRKYQKRKRESDYDSLEMAYARFDNAIYEADIDDAIYEIIRIERKISLSKKNCRAV